MSYLYFSPGIVPRGNEVYRGSDVELGRKGRIVYSRLQEKYDYEEDQSVHNFTGIAATGERLLRFRAGDLADFLHGSQIPSRRTSKELFEISANGMIDGETFVRLLSKRRLLDKVVDYCSNS